MRLSNGNFIGSFQSKQRRLEYTPSQRTLTALPVLESRKHYRQRIDRLQTPNGLGIKTLANPAAF